MTAGRKTSSDDSPSWATTCAAPAGLAKEIFWVLDPPDTVTLTAVTAKVPRLAGRNSEPEMMT